MKEHTKTQPQQTSLFAPKTCAFTGHRELAILFSKRKLKKEIEKLIKEGIDTFYSGLATGFDTLACEVVISLKKKYKDVRLIGCAPCLNQDKYYSQKEKKKYQEILEKADEIIYVSSTPYYNGCMHKRNAYMCDRADVLVAHLYKETGGTAYTVNYFTKKYPQKRVLFI